jgi:hypothetical protein
MDYANNINTFNRRYDMTVRNFNQYALGFGPVPCQVVFQIDNNTVFNGTVSTLDEPIPSLPNPEYMVDNAAWTWQDDVEFSGTKFISVAVTGSALLFGVTLANNPFDVANADSFGAFYSAEIDGVQYADPFTEQAIDGVAQSVSRSPANTGQWWWYIPAGKTFTATMHVNAPVPPQSESAPE